MKFTKMHGAGNDYVYVNCFEEPVPKDPGALARRISHRHFGVGSDGLILIMPGQGGADATMEMYNADGSRAEMCGNGLRCLAKYVYDRGIARKSHLRIMTGAGLLDVEILSADGGKAKQLCLNMGKPILNGKDIPSTWDLKQVVGEIVEAKDREFIVTALSMGNPHCVVYVDDVKGFPVDIYGPALENHERFPRRVNVELVEVVSRGEVIQRTWERGAGETWACGTGAAAVCVAGALTDRTDRRILIHLLGGDLELQYTKEGHVLLTGSAEEVFTGELD